MITAIDTIRSVARQAADNPAPRAVPGHRTGLKTRATQGKAG